MFVPHPQVDEECAGVRARGAVELPLHTGHPSSVLRIPPTDVLGHLPNGDRAEREVHESKAEKRKPLDATTLLLLLIHLR